MIKLRVFLNAVLIIFLSSEVKGKYNGDECDTTEGIAGTCRYLTDCETAKNNIFKEIFPDICGFEGIKVIVCCTNSTTPTNTTTKKPVGHVPTKITDMSKNSNSNTAIGDRAKKSAILSIVLQEDRPEKKNQMREGTFPFSPTSQLIERAKKLTGKLILRRPEDDPIKVEALAEKMIDFRCFMDHNPITLCQAYSQYALEIIENPTLSIYRSFSKILECPIKNQKLIVGVGGTKAGEQEFPHMVQIAYGTGENIGWDCGGSLISETFVLTAAHCLMSKVKGDARLVRGGISNQNDTLHLQVRKVIERIKYPNYEYKKYHDIALLKVDESFELNTYLRPACLHTDHTIPVEKAIASGWGLTDFAGDAGSQDLVRVDLEFYSTVKCNSTYRNSIEMPSSELPLGIIEDIMVCAGSRNHKRDTCQGDSGGPLQIIRRDTEDIQCMYDIVGITSFGIGCGLAKDIPSVYTRVSHYIEWIEQTVWPYI